MKWEDLRPGDKICNHGTELTLKKKTAENYWFISRSVLGQLEASTLGSGEYAHLISQGFKVKRPLPGFDDLKIRDSFEWNYSFLGKPGDRFAIQGRNSDRVIATSAHLGCSIAISREGWPGLAANFKRAEVPKLPDYDTLAIGDSFNLIQAPHIGRWRVTKIDRGIGTVRIEPLRPNGRILTMAASIWNSEYVTDFKRADAPKLGGQKWSETIVDDPVADHRDDKLDAVAHWLREPLSPAQVLKAVKDKLQSKGWAIEQSAGTPIAPHPGYANVINGIPATEAFVEAAMRNRNDEYAARQERHKQDIMREMLQPWRPGTNGLGSGACVMFKEGRKL